MSLEEQRAVHVRDSRRQTYPSFLTAADAVIVTLRTGDGNGEVHAALGRAFGAVLLEGPAEVVRIGEDLLACLPTCLPAR
jgi:hypothetical protein